MNINIKTGQPSSNPAIGQSFSVAGKGPGNKIALRNSMEKATKESIKLKGTELLTPEDKQAAETIPSKELTTEEICRQFLLVLENSPHQISEEAKTAIVDYVSKYPQSFTRTKLFAMLSDLVPLAQSGNRIWDEEEWKNFYQQNRDPFRFLERAVADYLAAHGQVAIQNPKGKQLELAKAKNKEKSKRSWRERRALKVLGYQNEDDLVASFLGDYKDLLTDYEVLQGAVAAAKIESEKIAEQNRRNTIAAETQVANSKNELERIRHEIAKMEILRTNLLSGTPGIAHKYRQINDTVKNQLTDRLIIDMDDILKSLKNDEEMLRRIEPPEFEKSRFLVLKILKTRY